MKLTVNAPLVVPVRVNVYDRFGVPSSATDTGDTATPTVTNSMSKCPLIAPATT